MGRRWRHPGTGLPHPLLPAWGHTEPPPLLQEGEPRTLCAPAPGEPGAGGREARRLPLPTELQTPRGAGLRPGVDSWIRMGRAPGAGVGGASPGPSARGLGPASLALSAHELARPSVCMSRRGEWLSSEDTLITVFEGVWGTLGLTFRLLSIEVAARRVPDFWEGRAAFRPGAESGGALLPSGPCAPGSRRRSAGRGRRPLRRFVCHVARL